MMCAQNDVESDVRCHSHILHTSCYYYYYAHTHSLTRSLAVSIVDRMSTSSIHSFSMNPTFFVCSLVLIAPPPNAMKQIKNKNQEDDEDEVEAEQRISDRIVPPAKKTI